MGVFLQYLVDKQGRLARSFTPPHLLSLCQFSPQLTVDPQLCCLDILVLMMNNSAAGEKGCVNTRIHESVFNLVTQCCKFHMHPHYS